MQKLITIWFLSFFFLQMTQANNHPLSLNPTNSETTDDYSCNLNPPSSFYPISVGAHNVLLGWSAVAGASTYEIQASIGGSPFGPAVSVPGTSTSFDYDGLPSGTTVDFQIWSVCNNGQRSSAFIATSASTIVIELIAQTIENCTQGNPIGDPISFSNGVTAGVVPFGFYEYGTNSNHIWGELTKNGANVLTFRITIPNLTSTDTFKVDPVSNQVYSLCVTPNTTCENSGYAGEVRIKSGTNLIGKFTFTKPGAFPQQQGSIKLSSMAQDHVFRLATKTCNNGGSEGDNPTRSAKGSAPTGTVNNPFHDLLIYNSETLTEDDVTLSLMDMNGRILRTQKMAGGQDQYSLQTADITPGMYVLRVQTGKQVKVIQVVKTN